MNRQLFRRAFVFCLFGACLVACGGLGCNCTGSEAARTARARFGDTSFPLDSFLRLVDTNQLPPGCIVLAAGRDFERISWPVPETGHLVVLDRVPDQPRSDQGPYRRLVAFIPLRAGGIRFVTDTNAVAEDISIQWEDGTLTTNFSWKQF